MIIDLVQLKALAGSKCKFCGSSMTVRHSLIGSCVQLDCLCVNGHIYKWASTNMHYNKNDIGISHNDLLLGAAILLSGSHFAKVKRMFDILSLQCISESTYYRYQRMYYAPVVLSYWKNHQSDVIKRYVHVFTYLKLDAHAIYK